MSLGQRCSPVADSVVVIGRLTGSDTFGLTLVKSVCGKHQLNAFPIMKRKK